MIKFIKRNKVSLLCLFGLHKWSKCFCVRCGDHHPKVKRHDWTQDCRKCKLCGMERPDENHSFRGCKCRYCEETRNQEHDWSHDCEKCWKCGKTRKIDHKVGPECRCQTCGRHLPHVFPLDPKSGKKYGSCLICGHVVPEKEKCFLCGDDAQLYRGCSASYLSKWGNLCYSCIISHGICFTCRGTGVETGSYRPTNDQILAGAMPIPYNKICYTCKGTGVCFGQTAPYS
jgi:hypothetical protein